MNYIATEKKLKSGRLMDLERYAHKIQKKSIQEIFQMGNASAAKLTADWVASSIQKSYPSR